MFGFDSRERTLRRPACRRGQPERGGEPVLRLLPAMTGGAAGGCGDMQPERVGPARRRAAAALPPRALGLLREAVVFAGCALVWCGLLLWVLGRALGGLMAG